MIDGSARMLEQIRPPAEENGHAGIEIVKQHLDEEQITGEDASYDLAYSCLSLHWINDLPGVFRRVLRLLKNDAPFIGRNARRLEMLDRPGVFRGYVCFRYSV